MKNRLIDKISTIILIIVFSFFIISSSIIYPLVSRSFYYNQIDSLNICETSGYDKETIIEAFDDVMDFIWKGSEFKTGSLNFSESGKDHFADCIPLFKLDLAVLIITSSLIIIYFVLLSLKVIKFYRFNGYNFMFYSGLFILLLLLIIAFTFLVICKADFDLLFELFHKIAFPNKSNWLFNPYTDEVINILPEEFFMNCGIFIGSVLSVQTILSIALPIIEKKRISHE